MAPSVVSEKGDGQSHLRLEVDVLAVDGAAELLSQQGERPRHDKLRQQRVRPRDAERPLVRNDRFDHASTYRRDRVAQEVQDLVRIQK